MAYMQFRMFGCLSSHDRKLRTYVINSPPQFHFSHFLQFFHFLIPSSVPFSITSSYHCYLVLKVRMKVKEFKAHSSIHRFSSIKNIVCMKKNYSTQDFDKRNKISHCVSNWNA